MGFSHIWDVSTPSSQFQGMILMICVIPARRKTGKSDRVQSVAMGPFEKFEERDENPRVDSGISANLSETPKPPYTATSQNYMNGKPTRKLLYQSISFLYQRAQLCTEPIVSVVFHIASWKQV